MYSKIAEKIFNILYVNKRTFSQCNAEHEDHNCFAAHLNKITRCVEKNSKITSVLPAFPAKSPNASKTYSSLPDMGERLSLGFLNDICEQIKQFYSPGAEVIICSDGRVFNDLVKVKDTEVDAYAHSIREIISEDKLTNLHTFSLDDHYANSNYETMRMKLVDEYGDTEATIKNNIKNNSAALQLFNGIHRFIYEDNLLHYSIFSKNKIKTLSKEIAYQVIQRSNAWSLLVEKEFPDAIRLSIHPQDCSSSKMGIMLLKSIDMWATPWHRVVLYDGKEHILIRKKEAETMGAVPVFVKNQFSHYAFLQEVSCLTKI